MALALAFNQERHLVAEEVMALHGVVPSGARSPLVFRINAPIAHGLIERALNEVIRRHSALRTAYGPNERYSRDDRWLQLQVFARSGVFVPGLYVQRVLSDVQLTVPVRTVAGTDELTELLRQELATPLDTTSGPPIRATLVDAGSAGTYLVLVLTHHTVDGWSLGVLAREFAAIIEAGADGTALPRVPMQYHDFAAWQLQQFRDGRFVREERFWHEQWDRLGDAQIAFTDLPFRRRTPVATVTAGTSYERLFFTPQESSQVSLLVSQLTLTPYALFRTAMTIALHYYTGKQRLAVWANFANRRYPEFMPTLGWYSNTHIVSVELEPDMSCASLCRRVAAGVAQAQAHEALPLPALWQRLGRSLDRHNTRVNFDVLPRRPQRTSPPRSRSSSFPSLRETWTSTSGCGRTAECSPWSRRSASDGMSRRPFRRFSPACAASSPRWPRRRICWYRTAEGSWRWRTTWRSPNAGRGAPHARIHPTTPRRMSAPPRLSNSVADWERRRLDRTASRNRCTAVCGFS